MRSWCRASITARRHRVALRHEQSPAPVPVCRLQSPPGSWLSTNITAAQLNIVRDTWPGYWNKPRHRAIRLKILREQKWLALDPKVIASAALVIAFTRRTRARLGCLSWRRKLVLRAARQHT